MKRISVRATEIETFDRASVIIPNSSLISGVVKNWYFRDNSGRTIVAVGVGYDSDPDAVQGDPARLRQTEPSWCSSSRRRIVAFMPISAPARSIFQLSLLCSPACSTA